MEIITKAGDIISKCIKSATHCAIAQIDLDGYPTVSSITPSKSEGIHWITFCTGLNSNKSKRIIQCNTTSICFNSNDYNITLIGTMEIITDPVVKKDMWYEGLSNHFSGPEDPNYCVLVFKTQRYNLFIDWQEVKGNL